MLWQFCSKLTESLDELLSKKRFSESARVLLDYAKDVRQAVNALVQGNEFAEARRIVSLFYIEKSYDKPVG